MADDTAVRVAIRVRPFVGIERASDCTSVVSYPSATQIQLSAAHSFTYDHLYPETSQQAEVYDTCIAGLVQSFFQGYNATVLAYGQTGSGKTHTMGTASSVGLKREEFGIIPRVILELFDLMKSKEATHTYILQQTFLEIYNDDIIDLLCPIPRGRADRPVPQIKEGRHDRIEVEHVTKLDVRSHEDAMDALERGSLNRATGSTNMNATSSRSHAILTLQLSQKVREDEMGVSNDEFITSKFHFVDLAGSERLKRTGAVGARALEGIHINQGLLALGNVISALGDPTRKGGHVPYRDSKITRLLQDSLGGNSKTLMIANVSPADINRDETLSTLQYANRAKNIKNKPTVNRDPMSMKLDLLRGRIKELELELGVYVAGGVPTDEQKAEFAATAQAIAAGGVAHAPVHIGGSSHHHHHAGVGGSASGLSHLTPLHSHHNSMLEFPAAAVGLDEMVVKSEEWALGKEQLLQYEVEMRKLQASNSKLRQDVSAKQDEKLRVLSGKDAMRRKIEQIADLFPQVREFLVQERAQVDQEQAARKAEVAAAAAANPDAAEALLSPDAAESDSDEDGAFFALTASGGPEAPFNKDLTLLEEKNALIVKLLRKYRSSKARLAEDSVLFDKVKLKLTSLTKQNRALKRANEAGETYDDLDGSRDAEDDEEDLDDPLEDEPSTTRRDGGASLTSPLGGAEGVLSPSDVEDLDYDSSAEKEEEDVASLHTLAQLKEKEHAQQKRLLLDEQSNLSDEILSKEVFLHQLTEQNKRTRYQHDMYQQQVAELEREKNQKEARIAELEKLMSSKPTTAANANGGLSQAESKELLKSKAELKKVSDELKAYREKLRAAQDAQKRQHAADESRIKQLTTEIDRAKKARVDVAKKMDESSGKYKDWVANHENKMKLIQKDQRKNEIKLRTLNEELAQKNIQLKRMNEKNNLLSRKVRDQDSATQAAKSSKQAVKSRKPPPRANMPYLGNHNSNASDAQKLKDKSKAAGAATHRRKLTRDLKDPLGMVGHARSTSGSVTDGPLSTPGGADKLARDFADFLSVEQARIAQLRDLEQFQTQVEHYNTASADSSEQLMNMPDDATPDDQMRLEAQHSANEEGLRGSLSCLAQAKERVAEMDRLAAAQGASGVPLEERVAAKFKSVLNEPPKRVLAILLRTFLDMHRDGSSPVAPLVDSVAQEAHFEDLAPAAQTSPPAPALASPTHFRRSSAALPGSFAGGAITVPQSHQQNTSSLSSSPIFKASGGRSSLPSMGAAPSPPRNNFNTTRKSAAAFSPTPIAAPVAPIVNSMGMSFSPLQPHLSQVNGIANAPSSAAGDDEDELLHLRLPESAISSAGSGTATSLFDDDDGSFMIAAPLSSSGRTSSSSSTKRVGEAVFDRLTDPQGFTGTSKHLQHAPHSSRSGSARGSVVAAGSSTAGKKSGTPVSDEPAAAAHVPAARVPIHERLNDPKSYTGAQRARFAEGVKRAASRESSSRDREREDGFVLTTTRTSTSRQSSERAEAYDSASCAAGDNSLFVKSLRGESRMAKAEPTEQVPAAFQVEYDEDCAEEDVADDDEIDVDVDVAVLENKENVLNEGAQNGADVDVPTPVDTVSKPASAHARTRSKSKSRVSDLDGDDDSIDSDMQEPTWNE